MATRLRYTLPPTFGPIPLDEDPDARARAAEAVLRQAPPHAVPDLGEAVQALVQVGGTLRAAGCVLAGQLTLPDEDPGITAMLTVTAAEATLASPVTEPDPDLARGFVDRLASEVASRNPGTSVGTGELGCGPVVTAAWVEEYEMGEVRLTRCRTQVMVPTPGLDGTVVVEVATKHTDHAASFADLAVDTASGLRFE